MSYDFGLILSVMIGGWLALDVAMAESWRRRSVSMGLLGLCAPLWAGAELLIRSGPDADELAWCRRLLYLGVAVGTFSWYWVAVEADAPRWFQAGRWRLALFGLPLALIHSTLYWAPDGTLISLHSPEPLHGPLFPWWAWLCWTMIAAGLVHYARAAIRMREASVLRTAALAIGISVPLVLNMAYATGHLSLDPAPALLGPSALVIRFAIIDAGLSQMLPLARSDIIEQIAVGVIVVDIHDRILDANASACAMLGEDDLRGRPLAPLAAELEPGIEQLRVPLESHRAWTGAAVVLTDRRDSREAEKRLQLAARLESLGSLTAGIAHEVNNPLAYVQSNLNAIEKLVVGLNNDPVIEQSDPMRRDAIRDGAESIADAKDGIERIARLVTRLERFAHDPDEVFQDAAVDLGSACRRAASVAGVGLPADTIEIACHSGRLARGPEHAVVQILVNLILNAVQASGEDPEIEVEVAEHGDAMAVRVADRGEGLRPEILDRIFDPFFTTKASGTGLGLGISFDMAKQLGGHLEAANRDDGGAVFALYLPAAEEETAAA